MHPYDPSFRGLASLAESGDNAPFVRGTRQSIGDTRILFGFGLISHNGTGNPSDDPAFAIVSFVQGDVVINQDGIWLYDGTNFFSYKYKLGIKRITTADTPYSISVLSDYTIVCKADTGVIDVALPDAATCEGQIFNVSAEDITNAVTITPNGTQTINGVAGAVTLVVVRTTITLQAFDGNWIII